MCVCLVLAAAASAATSPVISSISPNRIDAGGPYFLLTITGTGFAPNSIVNGPKGPLDTTFVSSTELKAAITPELRAISGEISISVTNPDTSQSNSIRLQILPVSGGVSPTAVQAGGASLTITVTGLGFIPRDEVLLNAASQYVLATTYVDSQTLTATVPAAARAAVSAQATIRILDPLTGAESLRQPFPILSPPVITAVSPAPIDAGGPYFLLTVTGSGFVPGSSARLGNTPLGTTIVNDTQLQAAITPEVRTVSGIFDLTVEASPGITSAPFPFAISPVLASLSPSSALAGSQGLTITASGIGFTAKDQLTVTIGGRTTSLTTTYVSPASLAASIPASMVAAPAVASIQVIDSAGADVSTPIAFTIRSGPAITSVSPNVMDAAGPEVILTVTGIGFVPSSVVNFNGVALGTAYVSPTQITGTLTTNFRALSGTQQVTVVDSAGGVSNASPVIVSPVLFSVSPLSAVAGSPTITLTATGAGFTRNDVVAFNGVRLPTALLNSSTLTGAIPPTALAAPGSAGMQVVDTTGAPRSLVQTFSILPAPPSISGLAPASVPAGSGFTLTVTGSGFYSGSVVQWNHSPLATSFISSTQLSVQVPASLVQSPGSAAISVVNAGAPISSDVLLTVTSSFPATILNLSPTSATAGAAGFTLYVTGSGFLPGSIVRWNGSPLGTSYTSATQLAASIPATLLASAGSIMIDVASAAGPASNAINFSIDPPRPVLSSLTPPSAAAGSPGITLVVAGAGFTSGSSVQWNGASIPAAFVDNSQLTATISAGQLAQPGKASITVANPDGAISSAIDFAIVLPTPGLTSITPAAVAAGSGTFTLSASGANFLAASVIRWNGAPLATRFTAPAQLTASVPAELAANPGSAEITVMNPGGLVSRPLSLALTSAPAAPAIAAVWNAFSGLPAIAPGTLVSIYGAGFSPGSTLVTIGGKEIPLLFSGASQINAQVPYETPAGEALLELRTNSATEQYKLDVASTAPGILTASGDDHGLAQNCGDGSPVVPEQPATPGQCIVVYMTGQGALDQFIATGAAAPFDPLLRPTAEVEASLGGAPASILFAGLTPGLIGVMQVNLIVPEVGAGAQPLVVTVGRAPANRVTVPVGNK